VPPPWRLGDGLVVLVRGAGAGVLVLVGVYLVGRWRGPNDPLLAAVSMPLMYAPLLWLARRRLFAPAGSGSRAGWAGCPAPGGPARAAVDDRAARRHGHRDGTRAGSLSER